MIDSHVHLRDGLLAEKETIAHALSLACPAGFTAFFDMPNTNPPLTNGDAVLERFALADKSIKAAGVSGFYGVYGGLTSDASQIEKMVLFYKEHFPKIVGFKMFAGHSTGNMGIVEKEDQRKVYSALARLGYEGLIAVHCEKESLMNNSIFDIENPITHSLARPPIAEIESIKDQIELIKAAGFKGHLHICHISTKEGIRLVSDAKKSGLNISCGVTAHHALLNIDSYKKSGLFVKMNPPLREKKDQEAVFKALISGEADWIESDHAPHTIEDKKKGASGIPGFAGSLILLKELRKAGCSEARLEELCGKAVNRIFKLNLPYKVPSNTEIDASLPILRNGYPFDAFEFM
ncbi:dihydroorotase [Treponema sp. OMZ 792]|uniref:dihydroorotase n=1 Tax=unclassified Treponema TaxID=2638727 RepID=UPI0020A327BA|nr:MULTISPECIES: dihydroorotase [unclassified Treponema]UTC75728.1 dihydroorotase [Treponema sp. OMZ 792]UTC79727.1 dihydroorotase [Treponema sp. OMZ 798]